MPERVPASATKRVKELRAEIEHHTEQYFVHDEPEIADAEFDALVRELRELEEKYPSLVIEESPTQRPGGYAASTFAAVPHRVPMLSLDNAFSRDELLARLRAAMELSAPLAAALRELERAVTSHYLADAPCC